jgi:hypothetical protein
MAKRSKKLLPVPPRLTTERMPVREKYWSELKSSEKIERMRTVVKHLQSALDEVRSQIRPLQKHIHDKDGNAVVQNKLGTEYGGEVEIRQRPIGNDPDQIYF